MTDSLSNQFTCSIVPSSGTLRVLGYTRKDAGKFDASGARSSTAVTIAVNAELLADSAAAMPAALAALQAAAIAAEGADFTVSMFGQIREGLTAANCLAGGPHVEVAYGDPAGPAVQGLTITATTEISAGNDPDGGGGGDITITELEYAFTVTRDVEQLSVIDLSGKLSTLQGHSAWNAATAKFVATPALYQETSRKTERDRADRHASWNQQFRQIVAAYAAAVLEGEKTVAISKDEDNGKVTVYDMTYTGTGAAAEVAARLTALVAAGDVVMKSEITTSTHKTRTVHGRFEVLATAEQHDADVISMTETVAESGTEPVLEQRTYPGASPLLCSTAESCWKYEQSGSCIALGAAALPPGPLFDDDNYSERPQIAVTRLDRERWQTTWRYVFLFASQQDFVQPNGLSGITGSYS